jgi:hypothetical protein
MEPVEFTRARYRPHRITTLFVGESAPASGAFFYHGDNAMLSYMQRATEAALGVGSGDFLDRFKALGWFLDDLVLTPVNALPKAQRRAKCLAAQSSLSERIREYQPLAIVSIMRGIKTSWMPRLSQPVATQPASDASREGPEGHTLVGLFTIRSASLTGGLCDTIVAHHDPTPRQIPPAVAARPPRKS